MKRLLILIVALSIAVPAAAFARGGGMGGMGSHSSVTGGVFGSSPASPGTNSLGTALSGGGAGGPMKGPLLGTGNAAVDREDARVEKQLESICRGC